MNSLRFKNRQQGLTLIEILIALVLGTFLLAGVIQIFQNSQKTNRMLEGISRLQENSRFAMDFVSTDIRNSDYLGCLRSGVTSLTNNLTALPSTDPDYDPNIDFDGSNGISGTNGAVGANLALDVPDSITLRGAFYLGIDVVVPYMVNTSANIKVSSSDGIKLHDIVLVSDCTSADIFEITTDPTIGGGAEVVVHNGGNVAVGPGNTSQMLSKTYAGDASIYRFSTVNYFIQNGELFRQIDTNAATALIEGIENMQILYGEDTDGNNTPNYYVPANSVVSMNQVVSIRVSILAVSLNDNLTPQSIPFTFNGATTTPADRRLRHVVSSTIAVRNRLR